MHNFAFMQRRAIDPAAQAYVSAIPTPTRAWILKFDLLARSLKASTLWGKVPLVYLGHNFDERAALVDFRRPSRIFVNSSCSWAANAGHQGVVASSGWIDLSCTWAQSGLTQNGNGIYTWVDAGTDADSTNARPAAHTNGGNFFLIPRNNSGVVSGQLSSGTLTFASAGGTAYGPTHITRRGAADSEAFKAGVSLGAPISTASAAPTATALALCRYAAVYNDFRIKIHAYDSGLTAAEAAALHAAFAAFVG